MNLKLSLSFLIVLSFFGATFLRAQENPLDDPDLKKMLKEAEELQKQYPPAKMSDLKKKAAEMEAEAKKEEAREEEEEKAKKAALRKKLEAQMASSGPGSYLIGRRLLLNSQRPVRP